MATKPSSPALLALTAAALAIPGMSRGAEAAVDYRFSDYREDPIAADKTSNADRERYTVQTHQFRLALPAGDDTDLAADLTYETMSGATPWFVLPDANGKPVQVMSGATVEDRRADILLTATRRAGEGSVAASGGFSSERDYRAINGGVQGSIDFDEKLGTLSAGVGYSGDTVEPTEGASTRFPDRIAHASRNSWTAFAGVAHVLGPDTQAQTSVAWTREHGYLSDPYKQAYVDGDLVPDARPGDRQRISWLTRLRQAFPGVSGALHADYRFYTDDWEITAHTVDVSWHQGLPGDFTVVPAARWYSQSQAGFYAPYYGAARDDRLYSSDYRLSPYGAVAVSLDVDKQIATWRLSLRYQRYASGGEYAVGKVEVESPGLVDFSTFSVALRKAF